MTVCFFGEAAVNNGAFHEALNMAALWKLPVIFICENNRYGMGTPAGTGQRTLSTSPSGPLLRIMAERVDGMDVLAMRDRDAQGRGAGARGRRDPTSSRR